MNFVKTKPFLVCIDSDGCAINTMTIKHERCFGPELIKEWGLEEFRDSIQKKWNEINLYSITRGINRFKGLAKMLEIINDKHTKINDLDSYLNWINTTKQFSNEALNDFIINTNSECCKKVLNWSMNVNKSVSELAYDLKISFKGCLEALNEIKKVADIAVVSSANRNAIVEEWKNNDLMEYVNEVFAQDFGTKSHCIEELLKLGYETKNVVKIGDASGDLNAALDNKVNFYPILINKETESWEEFVSIGLNKLINNEFNEYTKEKQKQFFQQFENGFN